MNILEEIFAHKKIEVSKRKRFKSLREIRKEAETSTAPPDFIEALKAAQTCNRSPALIAEVKFASPSKGLLVNRPNPIRLARTYQHNGAAAISVLTDLKYFQGRLEYLMDISALDPGLPTLRKDFICDEYQLYEARGAGASAVLLIAAMLEPLILKKLHESALQMEMTPLVEVHNHRELISVLECDPFLIGVNNRDLRDFSVDLETSLRLREEIPSNITMVTESGIRTQADVALLRDAGVDAILVGEALVTAPDIGAKVKELAVVDQRIPEK
jgi:indole-3-glycerol phosphate synthase